MTYLNLRNITRTATRVGLSAVFLSVPAAGAADLLSLYEAAMTDNPLLRVRESGVERARAEVDLASSRLYPQISLQATKSRNYYKDATNALDYNGQRVTLSARQAIVDMPSLYRRDGARFTAQQAESEASQMRMELTAQLTDVYLQALLAEDEMVQLQAEKNAASAQVERLRAMTARQMAKVTDLAEAVAYQQQLMTREIDAANKGNTARVRLRELSGSDPGQLAALTRTEFPAVPESEAAWVALALEASPKLNARSQALMASRSGAASARAEHLPQLSLSLTRFQSNQDIDNSPRREFGVNSVALELRVPIYEGGRTRAGESAAMAQLAMAEQQFEGIRREVERETRMNYVSAQANRARIDSTNNEVDALTQSVAAQERGFELGVVTVIGLFDARRRLLRSRVDQAKARYDYLRDLIGLRLRAGRLGATDVAEFNQWLGVRMP